MGVLFCEYILHAVVRSEGSTLVNQTVIFPAYHNELAQPKTILLIWRTNTAGVSDILKWRFMWPAHNAIGHPTIIYSFYVVQQINNLKQTYLFLVNLIDFRKFAFDWEGNAVPF